MSKLVDRLYANPMNYKDLKGIWKYLYLGLAVLAAGMLVTALYSQHQVIHMVGSTVGVAGMILINVITGYKKNSMIYFSRLMFIKELGALMIWLFLLYAWIRHPYI